MASYGGSACRSSRPGSWTATGSISPGNTVCHVRNIDAAPPA
ncbi:hypothetical protein H4W33_001144 [Kibdelosporangium phytohabitans]|nr:hypothetical protein [Kibdelosporangium phytohabitans]MBE1462132.1 hypothetical protein [Kibdelosporangium phytohabitans]